MATPVFARTVKGFYRIPDKYETLADIKTDLRRNGLESSQLIVAVDYTKSNEWNGGETFGGKCLHSISENEPNLYEWALTAIAATLEKLDDDDMIPCYGFGDSNTKDFGVFPFFKDNTPANGLDGVLKRYREISAHVQLSGPTNFAPIIHQALRHVIESKERPFRTKMEYHILLILADGQVTEDSLEETRSAIVAASQFPLSIIMVGVGDGPWDQMKEFDDELPTRIFDNFQFVHLAQVMKQASVYRDDPSKQYDHFALHALMEIPNQYKIILEQSLMETSKVRYNIPNDILQELPREIQRADKSNRRSE